MTFEIVKKPHDREVVPGRICNQNAIKNYICNQKLTREMNLKCDM